jgi:hypothetical protein
MFDSLIAAGILTHARPSADRTTAWNTAEHGPILKECEDLTPYMDRGWACLAGYQDLRDDAGTVYDRRRILHVHFNTAEDRNGALAGRGLIACGMSVRPITAEDRAARNATIDPRYRKR